LADASIDRFFICDTWHHIENRDRYLALLKKMLKPGGQGGLSAQFLVNVVGAADLKAGKAMTK